MYKQYLPGVEGKNMIHMIYMYYMNVMYVYQMKKYIVHTCDEFV